MILFINISVLVIKVSPRCGDHERGTRTNVTPILRYLRSLTKLFLHLTTTPSAGMIILLGKHQFTISSVDDAPSTGQSFAMPGSGA